MRVSISTKEFVEMVSMLVQTRQYDVAEKVLACCEVQADGRPSFEVADPSDWKPNGIFKVKA